MKYGVHTENLFRTDLLCTEYEYAGETDGKTDRPTVRCFGLSYSCPVRHDRFMLKAIDSSYEYQVKESINT